MNSYFGNHRCVALSFAVLAISCAAARATTIDFNGIPDGTPVSAGNDYAGLVNIEASVYRLLPDGSVPPNYNQFVRTPVTIQNGAVRLQPPYDPLAVGYGSELFLTFLQPVVDISYSYSAWWEISCKVTAVDGMGNTITIYGPTGGVQAGAMPRHIVIPVPAGYGVTALTMGNYDKTDGDAWFTFDDLSFQVTAVPDSGHSWALLALSCLGLIAFARLRPALR